MNISSTLSRSVLRLEGAGIPEARVRAEWLLAHVLSVRRLELPLMAGRALAALEEERVGEGVARLCAGEPLQYVLGETDFLGRTLKTDRRALIPRPETEQLVEHVLADAGLWSRPAPAVADVGTGSGCIVIALARAHPQAGFLAIDADPAALDLARENARAHDVDRRIRFVRGDLLDGVAEGSRDAVVSNPPYVATAEWEGLSREVRDFEPRGALDGGADGLGVISRLVPQAFRALKSKGRLYLEIGENQARGVREQMGAVGFTAVKVVHDLAGHERFACGIKA